MFGWMKQKMQACILQIKENIQTCIKKEALAHIVMGNFGDNNNFPVCITIHSKDYIEKCSRAPCKKYANAR